MRLLGDWSGKEKVMHPWTLAIVKSNHVKLTLIVEGDSFANSLMETVSTNGSEIWRVIVKNWISFVQEYTGLYADVMIEHIQMHAFAIPKEWTLHSADTVEIGCFGLHLMMYWSNATHFLMKYICIMPCKTLHLSSWLVSQVLPRRRQRDPAIQHRGERTSRVTCHSQTFRYYN